MSPDSSSSLLSCQKESQGFPLEPQERCIQINQRGKPSWLIDTIMSLIDTSCTVPRAPNDYYLDQQGVRPRLDDMLKAGFPEEFQNSQRFVDLLPKIQTVPSLIQDSRSQGLFALPNAFSADQSMALVTSALSTQALATVIKLLSFFP